MPITVGTRLGPYEIVARLGAGAMGEVYRARDVRLQRTVALKVLSAAVAADERARGRFDLEARAVAALNHPHICALYDVGREGGIDYLVMEHLEGRTLAEHLAARQGGAPDEGEVRQIAIQIAEALEAAHRAGIVHRDLKPTNVFLVQREPGGRMHAKLLDFGVAKASGDAAAATVAATTPGMLIGTAAYMSPEQAQGLPIDARSDIFAFGVLLYEMLSGQSPFRGRTPIEVIAAIVWSDPAPPDGPAVLQRVVVRCMKKAPADRFQTMSEVLEALRGEVAPTEQRSQGPSIAVLPFANLSADPENEYFGDGLAEEIINALTRVSGLKVIARTSAFAFKGKLDDIRKIADMLGVVNVLEGSVRRAGNRVRIMVQLVTARDGSHLWSQRYDREMTDVFAVQDEIAQAIAAALEVQLLPVHRGAVAVQRANAPAAYEAYVTGRHHMRLFTAAGMARGRECFHDAMRLDPQFALPHVGLAECSYYEAFYMSASPREVMPAVHASIERALELDSTSAAAYVLRALVRVAFEFEWALALEDAGRAMAMNPQLADAHRVKALASLWLGRYEEALTAFARAVELDPMNPVLRAAEPWVLTIAGRREEGLMRARAVIELFRGFWLGCFTGAIVLSMNGLDEEAARVVERGLQIDQGNVRLLGLLAWLKGRLGAGADAARITAQLDDAAARGHVPPLARAIAVEGSGDLQRSFDLLNAAYEEREPTLAPYLVARRTELRNDPRYQALLRRMNMTDAI